MEGRAYKEPEEDNLGKGQDTATPQGENLRTGTERSLERGDFAAGCHQTPAESEDPSFAPAVAPDHCNRHAHHVHRHHMLRELEAAGNVHPIVEREVSVLDMAGRMVVEESVGIVAGRRRLAAVDKSGGHSWDGNSGRAEGRVLHLVAGVAHALDATTVAAENSRVGLEDRSTAREPEGRSLVGGRTRTPGVLGDNHHDRGHHGPYRCVLLGQLRMMDKVPGHRSPVQAEGVEVGVRSCTTCS